MWELIKDGSFYTMLQEVFVVLEALHSQGKEVEKGERFLYKGILLSKIPSDVYVRLCYARFTQTSNEDERFYFANCALRVFKRSLRLRARFHDVYSAMVPYRVKHYRAKYETLYGPEITQELTDNLSKKMSSLDRSVIERRNESIRNAARIRRAIQETSDQVQQPSVSYPQ